MIAIGRGFIFTRANNADAVLPHEPADTPVSHDETKLLELFSHAWTPITTKRQAMLLTNMGKQNHILTLTPAHRARPPGPKPARAHLQNPAEPFD